MNIFSALLTVAGLSLFETISSIDNAVINAEVLSTMGAKARRWFLMWGLLFAVFIIRGLLPWAIVWATTPALGPIGSLTAAFSGDPSVSEAIERSSPVLLMGGGIFLIFLFFHWLFLEPKHFGLPHERLFLENGVWFYTLVSVLLLTIVILTVPVNPFLAVGAVAGSTAFFITHGFKEQAEKQEEKLLNKHLSDTSKILFLEVIDATFSIDGVLGAFAFTLSVPLIILGNGLGAFVVRQITIGNIERIKRYKFLKNGAMYSILALGSVMVLDGLGLSIPEWISPVVTFVAIGYFFLKSRKALTSLLSV